MVSRRIIAEIWVAFSQNLSDNLGDRDLEEDVRGLPNAHIDQYLETDPAGRDPETYKAKKQW